MYQELESYRPSMHAIYFNAHKVQKLSYTQSANVVFKSGSW